jgi:hypothetical protein
LEARERRVAAATAAGNLEKATRLSENMKWKDAMERAQGHTVKVGGDGARGD